MSKMRQLCTRLQACVGATMVLGDAKVNRETWETHPLLVKYPNHLVWLAIAVGVDPRWIGAALLWSESVIPDLEWTMDQLALARWTQKPKGTPLKEEGGFLLQDFRYYLKNPKNKFNRNVVSNYVFASPRSHKAILKVLSWDVVKSAMLKNRLGKYLDE